MKGLRKYLTPFAPDQSGAVSVLFEMGGIIVICDAGGCVGNICGFDEPRWFSQKSAIFSAGLRDMDAILGRDDRLVAKLVQAVEKLDAEFVAVIGTPVPAVIGTDYHALQRMIEKKTGLPVITVDTDGMDLYDVGEEKAWLALFRRFAVAKETVVKGRVGILGATPLSLSDLNAAAKIKAIAGAGKEGLCFQEAGLDVSSGDVGLCLDTKDKAYSAEAKADSIEAVFQQISNIVCYGMGDGLDAVKSASSAEWNLVVSPSAITAAEYLKKNFGTPYRVGCPWAEDFIPDIDFSNKKVLIIHQQVLANSLRAGLENRGCGAADIRVATWFMLKRELAQPQDILLKEEDQFKELVDQGYFDYIFGDSCFETIVPDFTGTWIDVPHFAASGRLLKFQIV